MKIEATTLSIVTGSRACNARCPYCVSKMTPSFGMEKELPVVDWRAFEAACRYSRAHGITTALFTGKGEPTLFPQQITTFLSVLRQHEFPLIELQTNGIVFEDDDFQNRYLETWKYFGLTSVCLSIGDIEPENNARLMTDNKPKFNWNESCRILKQHSFMVRVSCVICKGHVDNVDRLKKLVEVCRDLKVDQLTVRELGEPEETWKGQHVKQWVDKHKVCSAEAGLEEFLCKKGTELLRLPHGAVVYDLNDQNVCLNNCLTYPSKDGEIRQLIFCPDNHLRYDWQKSGALIF